MLQQALLQILKESYHLKEPDLKSSGSIWKVSTPTEQYVLKAFQRPLTELTALANTLTMLQSAGFTQFIPLLANRQGEFFWEYAGRFWSLSPWYHGEHPDFKTTAALSKSATLLGKLHQTASTLDSCTSEPLVHLIQDWEQQITFLEETITKLKQFQHNRIDRQTLNWSTHFLTQANTCYQALLPLEKVKFPAGFCHHDPAPRNILIYQNQCYLLDFEFAGRGFFLLELANLMRRALQLNQWADWVSPAILSGYQSARPLNENETQILPYLVAFPRHFWRFCHQRYRENLPRHEKYFAHRLWEITNAERARG